MGNIAYSKYLDYFVIILPMQIMKFGGSSVANADRIRNVADIVISKSKLEEDKPVVVVSAMKGVTDALIRAASTAGKGDSSYKSILKDMMRIHYEAADTLFSQKTIHSEICGSLNPLFKELEDVLRGVFLIKECSPRTNDLISGFGERLSCLIIAAYISSDHARAEMVDARTIIRTDNRYGRATVDFETTAQLVRKRLKKNNIIRVVTGFISSTANGIATTLGRNGSDYTASLLGAALNASSVEIWTDVDGVFTADPRIVSTAWVIEEISFQEAMEMSFFGAEVIHPYTLLPVIEKKIPVYIKNTLNPSAPGTRIAKNVSRKNQPITGIASIDNVSMITIEGGDMIGMPGIINQIFSSISNSGANIIMISQASSEHSVCLILRYEDAHKALKNLKKDLSDAISSRIIRSVKITDALEIIAIIGDNMRGQIGICGKLFNSLGKADVNILAIAQGSTELNISIVISNKDEIDAILAIHKAFLE